MAQGAGFRVQGEIRAESLGLRDLRAEILGLDWGVGCKV